MNKILVINPGSTSTKVALYEDDAELNSETLEHSLEELKDFNSPVEQYDMRMHAIMAYLDRLGVQPESLTAIAARGGGFGPMKSGAYIVDENLVRACQTVPTHVSLVATIIAYEFVKKYGLKAYIYDAITADEMAPYAKITGLPEIQRRAAGHVLNSKAVAREVAKSLNKEYESGTFVVAHLGGGCTTTLHKEGRILDIVSSDDGTFTPERAGKVPTRTLIKLCYSGKYTEKEIIKRLYGQSGLVALLGTNNAREVERRIEEGDAYAKTVYFAMAYQISKDIGAMLAAAGTPVDRIILTGGLSHSKILTQWICEMISHLAPIEVVPGSMEMQALASGILRVLQGEEEAHSILNN